VNRLTGREQAVHSGGTDADALLSSALRGLSKPSKCRFFAKNSLTEISFCAADIASAVERRLTFAVRASGAAPASDFGLRASELSFDSSS
jgi:hypothetical protein